jgi:solute carrier family 25 protein 38
MESGIPSLAHLAAGSTSSLISTILLQPLDVIKTKQQQLLINPVSKQMEVNTKYRTMFGTLCTVVKEDGIRGLWRGTAPSLCRTVPGSGVYFFMLSNIHPLMKKIFQSEGSFVALLSGFSARTLATITLMPFTVIKTRFEATGTNVYKNTFDALKTIARYERLRGLYSGLLPTVLRDAPFSGIYFMFYSRTKQTLEKCQEKWSVPSPLLNLSAGMK